MARTATDDLDLLATRLRLGIPLTGFDGRAIPLRHRDGTELDAIEAAQELLESGARLLSPEEGDTFIDAALDRAYRIEASAIMAGDPSAVVVARITGVLVSAAIRATVLAQAVDASPTDSNRATLAWYEVHDHRRRELLRASAAEDGTRLSA